MFNEKDHPRGQPENGGQFVKKDGKEAEREKTAASIRKYSDDPEKDLRDMPSPRGKNKSRAEFFGEEFKGVKGKDAVEKLLKEKRGHVKNAFERPEIGGIDIVWGDDTGGLQHTIMRRDKMLSNGTGKIGGLDMVKKIPEIIENGTFDLDENDRPGFEYEGCRVAVRPTYDGIKLNWIVTAMEITALKNPR